MAAKLHLAGREDLPRLGALALACRTERAQPMEEERLAALLTPLLDGLPHGAIYLVGPRRAPLGYVLLSFGYSLEAGGIEATLQEVYLRPQVRGRGLAREALGALLEELGRAGLGAIHLDLPQAAGAGRLFTRLGFAPRAGAQRMTRRF